MMARAEEFDHRCIRKSCCCYGERTGKSCECHVPREKMMLAEIERLRNEIDVVHDSLILSARFDGVED